VSGPEHAGADVVGERLIVRSPDGELDVRAAVVGGLALPTGVGVRVTLTLDDPHREIAKHPVLRAVPNPRSGLREGRRFLASLLLDGVELRLVRVASTYTRSAGRMVLSFERAHDAATVS